MLRIAGLGMSGFTMSITNSSVQVMYNVMLQKAGGDLYVGIMTVINSVREVISMPVNGLTNSAQPVLALTTARGNTSGPGRPSCSCPWPASSTPRWCGCASTHFRNFSSAFFNRNGELVAQGIPAMRIYISAFS